MNDKLVRTLEERVENGIFEELCNDRDFEIEEALDERMEEIADGIIESLFENIFYECLVKVINRYPIEDDIIDYSRELIYEKLESYIEDKIRELMEE